MRILLAVLALFAFTTFAHAGQTVISPLGVVTAYNFTGTPWAAIENCDRGTACNPFNGSDATGVGPGDADGEGDGEGGTE